MTPNDAPKTPLEAFLNDMPDAYTRSASGKTKAEIQKLRLKFAAQVKNMPRQHPRFVFTPPNYDEEYFEAMAKLETD